MPQKPGIRLQATWNVKTLAPGSSVASGRPNLPPLLVQPYVELCSVEADEAPDLEIRDTSFGHQSLDVARGYAQNLGNAADVDEG